MTDAGQVTIPPILYGIVINHLPPGTADDAKRLLDLGEIRTLILERVESRKHGLKDMIKFDHGADQGLDALIGKVDKNNEKLALISPNITIYHIRNGEIEKRYHPQIPDRIVDIVNCDNSRCVTNMESDAKTDFELWGNGKPASLKCKYCESVLHPEDIPKYLK